jgi:FkbM family methyltransferase
VITGKASSHPVRDWLFNAAWSFGVQIRDLLKRRFGGILPDDALARLGLRLLPPPDEQMEISLLDEQRMAIPPRYPLFRGLATRVFEKDVVAYVSSVLKAGMTVVDLGANIGYYTLLASRLVGPSGVVYAFEPDPPMFAYLTRNVATNRCGNVITVNAAVTDRSGTASFVSSESVRGWVVPAPATVRTPVVKTVTLDAFFAARGWPPIHLIKLDVEGSEKSALQGMSEVCARNPGLHLIVEYNLSTMHRAGVTPEALGKTLGALGFATGYVIEQGFKPFSTAAASPKPAICNVLFARR